MDIFRFVVALVLARLGAVLAVPALGSGVWTYFAYESMVEPLGWGLKGRFIALIGAVMVTVLYWAGGWMLIRLVPRMGWWARCLALPAIAAFMTLVIGASSIPQVTLFHAPARSAETVEYVSASSVSLDAIKRGAQMAKGLGSVLEDIAVKIEVLADLEMRGVLSGVASAGAVHAWVRSFAADARQVRSGFTSGGTQADALIVRMDGIVAAMRTVSADRKLDFEARRTAFEGHGDAMRSASIELAQVMPLMAARAFARRLQGDLITPALSAKPDIREQQERALARVKTQLSTMGKDFEAQIAPIAAALEITPPVYAPAAPEILIFRYWHVLFQAWTISLSVDLFIIVLLWLACVAADEARAQERRSAARGPLATEVYQLIALARELEAQFRRDPVAIGAHPHPAAALARERENSSRRSNGADAAGEPT
jgi:hypothetical protein